MEEVVSKGSGCWLSHIIVDDETIWRIDDDITLWEKQPTKNLLNGDLLLESDTTKRIDIPFMVVEEWEEAESAKTKIEDLQRNDKKLRGQAEKKKK